MELLKEGDRGYGVSRAGARVFVEYRYRHLELDSGARVRNVLVGVDPHTERVLAIPAQSLPRIRETTRREEKRETLVARVPLELEDALNLVADELRAPPRFIPALVRLYLDEASGSAALARRLAKLVRNHPLAHQTHRGSLSVRISPALLRRTRVTARREGMTPSDLVRAIALAAAEDVLDPRSPTRDARAPARRERLAAVAAAV
jgi:hypothetical protein